MLKLEVGHDYQTKGGLRARIYAKDSNYSELFHGAVEMPTGDFIPTTFRSDGKHYCSSFFHLIKEWKAGPKPFTTWMCKVGDQPPMPAPNEEIARKWAAASKGRAFRVTEVIE